MYTSGMDLGACRVSCSTLSVPQIYTPNALCLGMEAASRHWVISRREKANKCIIYLKAVTTQQGATDLSETHAHINAVTHKAGDGSRAAL